MPIPIPDPEGMAEGTADDHPQPRMRPGEGLAGTLAPPQGEVGRMIIRRRE